VARVILARHRRRRGFAVLALVVVAVVAVLVVRGRQWIDDRRAVPSPTRSAAPTSAVAAGGTPRFDGARAQLAALPVRGWDRTQDFERYRFGEAWSDEVNVEFGHNGCNTRDDVLRRDLANLVVRPGTCYAQSGTLHDPYTGTTIEFVRGPDTSNSVEIDHVVSLADAWYKGARFWDAQRRLDFANDPRNLLAVSPKANFDKAFRDAASWLPPNTAFRCGFVARQIDVKTAYGLWVSAKEEQAMADVLERC
jgi:Protein of unknown function (DUF1524)